MLYPIYHGNGATCDVCGCILETDECIKIKTYKLDRSIDNTGRYAQINKMDICETCYNDRFLSLFKSIRIQKPNGKGAVGCQKV